MGHVIVSDVCTVSLSSMAKEDEPNWDGLLKWSLSHADGTRPTRQFRHGYPLSNTGARCNIISDVDTRDASLRGLLALAKARKCCTCGSSIEKGDEKLRQILEDRIKAISLMSEEDRSAAEEERQLLDSLWITLLA